MAESNDDNHHRKRDHRHHDCPLLTSGISAEAMAANVLPFLNPRSIRQLTNIKQVENQFKLMEYCCKVHVFTPFVHKKADLHQDLSSSEEEKDQLKQCEDCEQEKLGNKRCDDCNSFETLGVVGQCNSCGKAECPKCATGKQQVCHECNVKCNQILDSRNYYCDQCSVRECRHCGNSSCMSCGQFRMCKGCGGNICSYCPSRTCTGCNWDGLCCHCLGICGRCREGVCCSYCDNYIKCGKCGQKYCIPCKESGATLRCRHCGITYCESCFNTTSCEDKTGSIRGKFFEKIFRRVGMSRWSSNHHETISPAP